MYILLIYFFKWEWRNTNDGKEGSQRFSTRYFPWARHTRSNALYHFLVKRVQERNKLFARGKMCEEKVIVLFGTFHFSNFKVIFVLFVYLSSIKWKQVIGSHIRRLLLLLWWAGFRKLGNFMSADMCSATQHFRVDWFMEKLDSKICCRCWSWRKLGGCNLKPKLNLVHGVLLLER